MICACYATNNVYLSEKKCTKFQVVVTKKFEDKKMDYFKDEWQKFAKITFQLVKTII